MARADHSARPVAALRDAATSLEAAILVCLARPGKRAVHELRTATRRVEARLEFLALLPGLPPHQPQRRKALRLLKQLRHAAGDVRDLDVQRGLIRNEAAKGKRSLRDEARRLRRELKHKREEHAGKLVDLLHAHGTEFPLLFEQLLDQLAAAESMTVPESQLMTLVRDWYARPGKRSPQKEEAAELHEIRKRAKLARYLAESAPESATAARSLAARFEKLQEAGGKWHDWLLLADIASDRLGNSAALPPRFAAHAQNSLRTFKRRLGANANM